MNGGPDLLLTLALLGSALALGVAAMLASRPAPARGRMSDAELRRRFPTIHERMRGGARW
jgi:hypothetical protein